ncbi:MAG TPA: hypothetical protein PKY03_04470, partial [Moraxellaceae bacterium]|nr:hypothetical protein [Moraxellaceae bacterium]
TSNVIRDGKKPDTGTHFFVGRHENSLIYQGTGPDYAWPQGKAAAIVAGRLQNRVDGFWAVKSNRP